MEQQIREIIARVDLLADEDHKIAWSGPANSEAIIAVERALQVSFPASFRTFLSIVGGGGLCGLSISSIRNDAPLDRSWGTVYGDTLYYRGSEILCPAPEHLVIIQRDYDSNEPFCLDTSHWSGQECPVVLYYDTSGFCQPISKDFLQFYESYLEPYFEP